MDELAKRRAEKSGDSEQWSALDCLEDTVNRIKSGELDIDRISIQMLSKADDDGNRVHTYAAAGLNYESHIAILTVALQRTVNEWIT